MSPNKAFGRRVLGRESSVSMRFLRGGGTAEFGVWACWASTEPGVLAWRLTPAGSSTGAACPISFSSSSQDRLET